jgi:hypothetical protein
MDNVFDSYYKVTIFFLFHKKPPQKKLGGNAIAAQHCALPNIQPIED